MEQTENMAQGTIPVAANNESKILLNTNQIAAALMLIFTGEFLYRIPLDTWSVKIMWITAWIAILIGTILLYKNLQGNGKKAAGLWVGASLFGILSIPVEVIHSFIEGIAGIAKIAGAPATTIEGLGTLQSYTEWFLSLEALMYIGGTILFMVYPPFIKAKKGWGWLVIAFVLSLFNVPSLLITLCLFIGFYLILTRLYTEEDQNRKRIGAFIWMATGFLYSLFILLNNDTIYIIASLTGLIAWLIGVIKIRSLEYEKQGTGAFLIYAILMILSSIVHFLPGLVGDILAIALQVPAYIIVCVGFLRFGKGDVFASQKNGMHTMIGVMAICLILALVYLIPFVGEPISAMIFSILCVPCLVVGWKNALTAQSETIIEFQESEKTNSIDWSIIFGKHKKLAMTASIVILIIGVAYSLSANMLVEKMLLKAEETDNHQYTAYTLLEKLTGNAEAEFKLAADMDFNIQAKLVKKWCNNATKGDAYAQYVIGILLQNSGVYMRLMDDEARSFFNSWTAQNRGAMQIGNLTDFMSQNPTIDMQKIAEKDAHKWFEAAAQQGHPRAQFETSIDYSDGRGISTDPEKAYYWTLKAANNGHLFAQNNAGYFNTNGIGVEENPEEAFKWYKKAAERGYSNSQASLALFYYNGTAVEKDLEKAFFWFSKAATQEQPFAQYCLGILYRNGEGIEKDLDKAKEWFRKAADNGHEDAQKALNQLNK